MSGGALLSPRQLDCAKLAADGLQSKEIAQRLGLSRYTVQQYLSGAFVRLKVRNRTQLAMALVRAGLLAFPTNLGTEDQGFGSQDLQG